MTNVQSELHHISDEEYANLPRITQISILELLEIELQEDIQAAITWYANDCGEGAA